MSRRATGSLLVAYGVFGLVLTVVGMLVGFDLAARAERLSGSAGGTLEAAARATRAAADSFTSIDASLNQAQSSADGAADLARDASVTLAALASAMNITLLGSQPLQPLSAQFSASAGQAEELADTLESVTSSLGDTRTDVASIGTELGLLADELDALQSEVGLDSDPPPLRFFAGLLLAWVGIQATAILIYGVSLLRPPRADASA